MDIWVATTGLVLVLEATRRAVGWPMAALACLFIAYSFLGQSMPEAIMHKGVSLNRLLSHQWLTGSRQGRSRRRRRSMGS